MRSPRLRNIAPSWKNALLAILAAVLLILSFPDFEFWFLAWFALVPLMWAVERESKPQTPGLQKPALSKGIRHAIDSTITRSFILGWIFGTIFFFGTCWWLTYAPINYAAFPPVLAYFLLFCVTAVAGLFPGIFAAILSVLIRRFGSGAFLAAPFVWVFTEFARYWLTGNNWNAIGYSQYSGSLAEWASIGGVLSVSFAVLFYNLVAHAFVLIGFDLSNVIFGRLPGRKDEKQDSQTEEEQSMFKPLHDNSEDDLNPFFIIGALSVFVIFAWITSPVYFSTDGIESKVVAIQPNVPMSGLDYTKYDQLRQRQIEMAEDEIEKVKEQLKANSSQPSAEPKITVVLPESPMNFMYNDDLEFQQFIGDFAIRNNVSVLFNSAEPDPSNGRFFNSAVLVGPDGKKAEQYDKIYLLPFGEAVPLPLQGIVPAFVGTFSYGSEYDLVPLGDAKAGIMICFESHFGELSREYVRNGADAIIEMTNDGYLGPTPVLRQHLANAVFRAVETNRPVLRVTNVGITAYIDERGTVHDPLPSYQEGTRVWTVAKSDGSQTFYVKYGDWFAWLCVVVTLGLIIMRFRKPNDKNAPTAADI